MKGYFRAMVIPFFAALFPAVWYVNRNLTTEQLPPHVEPTTRLLLLATALAVAGSLVVAGIAALFRRRIDDERELPYRQRVFQPDAGALRVFAGFVSLCLVWTIVELAGIVPPGFDTVLAIVLVPLAVLGAPFLLLAPFAIRYHWAVVLGLVLSVLWMSLLANVLSDAFARRTVPVIGS